MLACVCACVYECACVCVWHCVRVRGVGLTWQLPGAAQFGLADMPVSYQARDWRARGPALSHARRALCVAITVAAAASGAQVHVWFGYTTLALLLGQAIAGLWKYVVKVRDDRRILKSHGHLGARVAGGRVPRHEGALPRALTRSARACRARDILVGHRFRHSGYVRNACGDAVF